MIRSFSIILVADENHPIVEWTKSKCMAEEKMIKEQLTELLDTYYNGSFLQMVCEYIRSTGMRQEEVEELLEAMRDFHARV